MEGWKSNASCDLPALELEEADSAETFMMNWSQLVITKSVILKLCDYVAWSANVSEKELCQMDESDAMKLGEMSIPFSGVKIMEASVLLKKIENVRWTKVILWSSGKFRYFPGWRLSKPAFKEDRKWQMNESDTMKLGEISIFSGVKIMEASVWRRMKMSDERKRY
jgi:hypothetical protein